MQEMRQGADDMGRIYMINIVNELNAQRREAMLAGEVMSKLNAIKACDPPGDLAQRLESVAQELDRISNDAAKLSVEYKDTWHEVSHLADCACQLAEQAKEQAARQLWGEFQGT